MTVAGLQPERAFCFGLDGDTLLGILHPPAQARASGIGVMVIVGGPQYRAGSHRQFVHLARRLAADGHAVLRFDVRGMGDSSGALRGFEHISADIDAALQQFRQREPELRRVVLWGLCDGASAALLHLYDRPDTFVHGLCLLNPWVRSEASQARTEIRHYYRQRLQQREFWLKLLRGEVAGAALSGLWRSLRNARSGARPADPLKATYQQRMAQAWMDSAQRGRPLLLVLSGHDYTAREFEDAIASDPHWRGALQHANVTRHDATGADHTFSSRSEQEALEALTLDWLRRLPVAGPTEAAS